MSYSGTNSPLTNGVRGIDGKQILKIIGIMTYLFFQIKKKCQSPSPLRQGGVG